MKKLKIAESLLRKFLIINKDFLRFSEFFNFFTASDPLRLRADWSVNVKLVYDRDLRVELPISVSIVNCKFLGRLHPYLLGKRSRIIDAKAGCAVWSWRQRGG